MRVLATAIVMTALAGAAHAATFSGTATGAWSNAQGGNKNVTNHDDSSSAPNKLAYIKWGTSTGRGRNFWIFDGVGSDPNSTGWTADAGQTFKVGDFIYHNRPTTNNSFSGADLDVAINLTSPLGLSKTFDFGLNVNTTANNSGSASGNSDTTTISPNSSSTSFSFDGHDYTFELLGFSADGGLTFLNALNVQENDSLAADLYGRITEQSSVSDVPLPAGLPLLISGLGFLGFVRSRASKA